MPECVSRAPPGPILYVSRPRYKLNESQGENTASRAWWTTRSSTRSPIRAARAPKSVPISTPFTHRRAHREVDPRAREMIEGHHLQLWEPVGNEQE